MKKFFFFLFIFVFSFSVFSQDYRVKPGVPTLEKILELKQARAGRLTEKNGAGECYAKNALLPDGLKILMASYPDLKFSVFYVPFKNNFGGDWKVFVTVPNAGFSNENRTFVFYYANGSMLPENEISDRQKYWTLLYNYSYKKPLRDPKTYTKEEIERMKTFGKATNRQNGSGTPMFFFDAVYGSYSRALLESKIKTVSFLRNSVNVHERLAGPLKVVEKRILEASKTDSETKNFIENIRSLDAFYWRVIADTKRKSFHSLGIAIDILPKNLKGKAVYWSWERDKNPEKWMLTPLKDRWMPSEKAIEIFEEEGFIWGGKWSIFDNMHFEYHPELCDASHRSEN